MTIDLHTKKNGKKKSRAKYFGLLKKMFISVKNKKTKSSIVLPILYDSRKERWQIIYL